MEGTKSSTLALQEHRGQYNDWKQPNKPAFKETLTSLDHPLR